MVNTTKHETALELEHLEAVYYATRLICGKVLVPCLCFVGMFANILNVFVLTRSWMSSSTNVHLTAVAVCDIFYLLFTFLFSLYVYKFMRGVSIFMYSVPFIHGTANLFSNTTTWLTVCFTVERYIAVTWPIAGRRFCTQQRARCVICVTCVLSFIITFPDYLKRTIVPAEYPNGVNATNVYVEYDAVESRFNQYLVHMGYDYVNQFIFVVFPMLLLIAFNSLLVRSVLQANKGRLTLVHTETSYKPARNMGSVREIQSSTTPQGLVVKEALEASMRTTVNIPSGITQAYGHSGNPVISQSFFGARRPILGEQQRITLMLITIVMAFVTLQLPSTVPTIVDNLWKAKILKQSDVRLMYIKIYSNVSNILLIINTTMNFVFYSLFSAKFRQTCYMLFPRCVCTKSNGVLKSGWAVRQSRFGSKKVEVKEDKLTESVEMVREPVVTNHLSTY